MFGDDLVSRDAADLRVIEVVPLFVQAVLAVRGVVAIGKVSEVVAYSKQVVRGV